MNAFSFLTYNAGRRRRRRVAVRRARPQAPLRLLEARPVAGRLRPRAVARPLPALQDAGDRDRRPALRATSARRGPIPEALDGGAVGVERRLYYRELVARFGHELALNWNLGEENTQTPEEQRAMAAAFSRARPLPPPRRDPHLPGRAGPRLHAAPRQGLRPHRRVAPEPVGRGAPAGAEVAARVGEGREALGRGERRAGRRRPRGAAGPGLRGLLRPGEGEGGPRVRPARRPPPHAVGHADGRRRGRRVLLRLLAAAERPPLRELAEPRALVGLRAGGARLLPRRAHPLPRDGARRRPGRAMPPRTTAATPSRSAARSTSCTCRRAARPISTSPGPRAVSPWPGSTRGRAARSRRARCARWRVAGRPRSEPLPRT